MQLLDHIKLSDGQKLYYSVNADFATATKRYLIITTRDVKYRIQLVGENE